MNDALTEKLLRQLTKVPGVEAVALVSNGEVEGLCPRDGLAARTVAGACRALQDMVDGFQMFDASPASVAIQLDDLTLLLEPMAHRWLVVAASGELQRSLLDLTLGLVRGRFEESVAAARVARTYAVP